MMLQTFADDSGNEPRDPIFAFGGFVAPAAKWAQFSTDWQAVLDLTPKLEYFKMNEAAALAGEFHKRKGWTEKKRDDRLDAFVEVIKGCAELAVHTSMRHDQFNAFIKSIPLPQRRLSSDNPYPLLATQLMLSVAGLGDVFSSPDKIEFIFDKQLGYDQEMLAWWPVFEEFARSGSNTNFAKYFGGPPTYKDEKEVLPLQAADLYAWQQRLNEKNNQLLYMPKNRVLRSLDRIPALGVRIGEDALRGLRDNLLQMGKAYAAANPQIPFVPASKKARRQARRKDRGKR